MIEFPTLDLTPSGIIIDSTTGAIVAPDQPETMPASMAEALQTYATAFEAQDALAFMVRNSEAKLAADIDAQIQALQAERETRLAESEDLAVLTRRLNEARAVVDATQATLDSYFAERAEKVSLDTGRVLVTWAKPRSTYSLAKPASWYNTEAAYKSLARAVLRAIPAAGSIAVELLADAVIDWLDPTEKVGATPSVKITVRSGDR